MAVPPDGLDSSKIAGAQTDFQPALLHQADASATSVSLCSWRNTKLAGAEASQLFALCHELVL
jgi:hypothetical protein